MASGIELSIVLPCLNEEETLAVCIQKAKKSLSELNIEGEIVVADNGSTDSSTLIAESLGARVVHVSNKGYGNALLEGFKQSQGKYIIMGDADDSYALDDLSEFVVALRAGADLVMGNRFAGGIEKGAMPFLHKYLGNPILSFIGQKLFHCKIRDFHCGLRGLNRQRILSLNLTSEGMEFASELVVKSAISNFKISEVPTTLKKDGRTRSPHLRTWRDGWRHLSFLLSYSPRWLFFYPGLALLSIGGIASALLSKGSIHLGAVQFSLQSLIFSSFISIIGVQTIWLAILAKASSTTKGLLPIDPRWMKLLAFLSNDLLLFPYSALTFIGIVKAILQLRNWASVNFGSLETVNAVRAATLSGTLVSLGFICISHHFLLRVILVKSKSNQEVNF